MKTDLSLWEAKGLVLSGAPKPGEGAGHCSAGLGLILDPANPSRRERGALPTGSSLKPGSPSQGRTRKERPYN